ncbi:MAG TPA: response regulator, partial [Steroidobacteraceae bacterium]|nr:response regulator [Steroidobacteraceae bacterium]
LKLAEEFLPHVVLLDIGLPEMDGYETAKRLRESAQLHDPVLVAITGYGHEADRQNSQRAGFDHHLVKPASIERLQEILAAIPNNQCRLTIAPSSEPLTV